MQRSDKTDETLQLEGQLCDNLGAMYLKHGLFKDAFKQHQQALNCFKQAADSTAMMNAYRNSGRAVRAQEQYTQAKQYYDSAFRVATFINDQAMLADLYLEMGRDYYMETGNFAKGIESVNQALEIGLGDNDTDIAHMTLGILYYYSRENDKAKSFLNQALRSERAGLKMSVYQTLYAIAYSEGDYQQALDTYDRLLSLASNLDSPVQPTPPKTKSYLLNKAVCLSNLKRYDEAERLLFRLNYESEDDANVNRVLAWTLTCNGKYEQAEKLYNQLLSADKPAADDLLNFGFCLWFSGHIDDAADCFHRYLKESGESKESMIENELELIRAKGITEPEIQMMLYIL